MRVNSSRWQCLRKRFNTTGERARSLLINIHAGQLAVTHTYTHSYVLYADRLLLFIALSAAWEMVCAANESSTATIHANSKRFARSRQPINMEMLIQRLNKYTSIMCTHTIYTDTAHKKQAPKIC